MERPAFAIALLVGLVVGATAVAAFLLPSERGGSAQLAGVSPTGAQAASTEAAPNVLDAAVTRLAARFKCGCGQCEDLLSACTCSNAAEERGYIRGRLLNGHGESDVIDAVQQKYGGLQS